MGDVFVKKRIAGSCRDTKITILDNMDLKSLLYDLWDILRQIVNRKTSHGFSVWHWILDRSNWNLPLKNILEVGSPNEKSAALFPGLRFPWSIYRKSASLKPERNDKAKVLGKQIFEKVFREGEIRDTMCRQISSGQTPLEFFELSCYVSKRVLNRNFTNRCLNHSITHSWFLHFYH